MARSPLFASLRRAVMLAADIARTGRPAALMRPSRRAVLGAVALAGCAPLRPARGLRLPAPVVIVGAGLAGLSAAFRLRQAGVPVRVLEAQSRVGGRVHTLRGAFSQGQHVELGAEFIDTRHHRLRALAAELSLPLDDLLREPPGFGTTWHFGGMPRTEGEIVDAFVPIARRVLDATAPLDGAAPSAGALAVLDRLSLAAWLDDAGVSGWIRQLIAVAYVTEMGVELEEQSALGFLSLIDANPPPFRVYGDSDERYRVRGGNSRLLEALAARVADAVETGSVVEAVALRADGLPVCTVRSGSASVTVVASQLLLAVPFTLLRRMRLALPLPERKRRAIAELGYGRSAKLLVGLSSRPWRAHRSTGTVFCDLPFQTSWDATRQQAGAAAIVTNFTGGRAGTELGEGTPSARAAGFVAALEAIFPGVTTARARGGEARSHWPTHPWSLGSYAAYRPGQLTGFGGSEGERVGNVHFAGEHCSRGNSGFMEGACETGQEAAAAIAARLGAA